MGNGIFTKGRDIACFYIKINEAHNLSGTNYQYRFGKRVYAVKGALNTAGHFCDLFIYEKEPVLYGCDDLTIGIYHKNISDRIYDYCDFEESHYCSVFEQIIDIDLCYDTMMILNESFKVEASKELMMIQDIGLAREKCKNCIYANCDAIDHELQQNSISLEEFIHRSQGINLRDAIVYTKPRGKKGHLKVIK